MSEANVRVRAGTAQRQRGRERVDKILDAARAVFLEEGYAGLRLRRVAEIAGISLGNLTYYFSSKADLFESMIDLVLSEYARRNEELSQQFADDPAEKARSYFEFLFADCRNPETQQFFYQFWATAAHDPFVTAARQRVYGNFYDQVCDICRHVNPDLPEETLSARTYLVMAMVEGLHVILGNAGRPAQVPEVIEAEFMKQTMRLVRS